MCFFLTPAPEKQNHSIYHSQLHLLWLHFLSKKIAKKKPLLSLCDKNGSLALSGAIYNENEGSEIQQYYEIDIMDKKFIIDVIEFCY